MPAAYLGHLRREMRRERERRQRLVVVEWIIAQSRAEARRLRRPESYRKPRCLVTGCRCLG